MNRAVLARSDRRVLASAGGRAKWLATAAATVVSTYALDLVATLAGVALVASGLLAGVGTAGVLTLLAASYLAWALGLRTGLAANALLLEVTGTSTNVLSKAAHDLAARRGARPRTRRLAASAGYGATELAKEIPYYVAAFGTSALNDPVTGAEAVVFLAGANLGAAGYEYALGRGTRAALRRSAEDI